MASLINIGMSGLNASQGALATVGNNIANANAVGYSRQQIVQGTAGSQQSGGVFIGTGTTLADVRRVYNAYLDAQLQTTTSLNGDAQAYLDQIGPIDKLLSDKSTGVSAALSSFFASLQASAGAPGSRACCSTRGRRASSTTAASGRSRPRAWRACGPRRACSTRSAARSR